MIKPLLLASQAALLIAFAPSLNAQSLLLQYTFDDATNPTADTGAGPAAPGTLIAGGSASGLVSGNSPSGTGSVFSTGDGINNYITTATAADPDGAIGAIGDVDKVDNLSAFTLTLWVNLQSIALNDRFMSDGGAPVDPPIGGFDFYMGGPTSGISASNFQLTLSVDRNSVNSSVGTGALNQWVFFAVTYDGTLSSNNVTFYSGTTSSAAAQLGATLTLNQGVVGDNTRPFQIGNTTQSSADRTPAGFFDDIRVYSGAGNAAFIESVRLANVPEPSAIVALLSGTALLGLVRRRHVS